MSQKRQTMMEAFDKRLESLLISQKIPIIVQPDLSPIVLVNTKEICLVAPETGGNIGFECQCDLHILVHYVSPPSWCPQEVLLRFHHVTW